MGRGTLASVARSLRFTSCRSLVFEGGLPRAEASVSRFRFPPMPEWAGRETRPSCARELVAVGCSVDTSLAAEFVEDGAEPGGTDATGLAQLCEAEWPLGLCERGLDPVG